MLERKEKIIKIVSFIIALSIIFFVAIGSVGGIKYLINNIKKNEEISVVNAEDDIFGTGERDTNYVVIPLNIQYYQIGSPNPDKYSFFTPFIFYYTLYLHNSQGQPYPRLSYYKFEDGSFSQETINMTTFRPFNLQLASICFTNNTYSSVECTFQTTGFVTFTPNNLLSIIATISEGVIKFIFNYENGEVTYNLIFDNSIRLVGNYFQNTYYFNQNVEVLSDVYFNELLNNNFTSDMNEWKSSVEAEAIGNANIKFNEIISSPFTFKNFFSAMFDNQISFFGSLITFDFFGYNFTNFYKFLIGLSVIIIILRFLLN